MELKIFRDTLPQGGAGCTVKAELPLETEIRVRVYAAADDGMPTAKDRCVAAATHRSFMDLILFADAEQLAQNAAQRFRAANDHYLHLHPAFRSCLPHYSV